VVVDSAASAATVVVVDGAVEVDVDRSATTVVVDVPVSA
jgi:hypothetical protein